MNRAVRLPVRLRTARPRSSQSAAAPPRDESASSAKWLLGFLAFQIACQLALLSPLGGVRVFVRSAAFVSCLALLLVIPRRTPHRHPATFAATAALIIVCLGFFNPTTNSALAGTAHAMLYVAVLAPLFWVSNLKIDTRTFQKLVLYLWLYYTASAVVGLLQVYYPGTFETTVSSTLTEEQADSLRFTLSNGESVMRPTGLSDTPGGAGMAGYYVVLLGIGFLLGRPRWWQIPLIAVCMTAGLVALYLSQIRSLVVGLAVSIGIIGVALGMQGKFGRFATLGAAIGGSVVSSILIAINVAGEAVTKRFSTLTETDAGDVYRANRGMFLEHTLTELLPQYPLGAGLGRYGMMMAYFGDMTRRDRAPIYVEIQWTGWLIDGGIPLMIAYGVAILTTIFVATKVGFQSTTDPQIRLWATVLLGYNVGALALTFNCSMFLGTMGIEFWLINAALFAAFASTRFPPVPERA